MSRPTDARPARRHSVEATTIANDLGFRVARDLSDEEAPTPQTRPGRIVLFTPDLEQAKRFWIETFGYQVAFEDTEFSDDDMLNNAGLPKGATKHFILLKPANANEAMIGLLETADGTRVVAWEPNE